MLPTDAGLGEKGAKKIERTISIFYTVDGSNPEVGNKSNKLFTGKTTIPHSVTKPLVIKAVAIESRTIRGNEVSLGPGRVSTFIAPRLEGPSIKSETSKAGLEVKIEPRGMNLGTLDSSTGKANLQVDSLDPRSAFVLTGQRFALCYQQCLPEASIC